MCFESAQTCLVGAREVQRRPKSTVDNRDITVGTVLAARVEGGVLAIIYINEQDCLRRVLIPSNRSQPSYEVALHPTKEPTEARQEILRNNPRARKAPT